METPLSLNMFVHAVNDLERSQFAILNGLKKIHTNFHHNRIYPDLAMLIELYETLQSIAQNADNLRSKLPKRMKDVDIKSQQIVYDTEHLQDADFAVIHDLILWSLPRIQAAIEEGKTMFEFIDENLKVEVVGILPSYLEEGYAFIPDNTSGTLYLIKYEVSIFTGAGERYRSLKTTVVQSVQHSSIVQSPQTLKLDLVKQYPELPNPATYSFQTELEFPFNESILPVAKRRLLRYLYS